MQPTTTSERIDDIDVIRGIALLGVLLINLVTIFRVSLFLQIEVFHTEPGQANAAVEWVLAMVVESKAFAIFSLLFGVGLSIFRERASSHGLLARRLLVLLGIGLVHLVFVWNGDILTAYALAGLLALPFLGHPRAILLALAVGALYCLPLPWPDVLPHGVRALSHGALAARVYGGGSWLEILAFRTDETRRYILPLLAFTFPRIWAMFLLGDWVWRRGILRAPDAHRALLRSVAAAGMLIGGAATALSGWAASTGHSLEAFWPVVSALSNVPLALGYVAGLLLLLREPRVRRRLVPIFASVGRMALTNYLTQSIACSLLFYGFGAGLFGKVGAAAGALIALGIYAAQVVFSTLWLRQFRFGPFERVWRSLTYGRFQA